MRAYRLLLLLYVGILLTFLHLAGSQPSQAATGSTEQVSKLEPFYAEYQVHDYVQPSAPHTEEDIARQRKRSERELAAKGRSKGEITTFIRVLEAVMRAPVKSHRDITKFFGAGDGCVLHGRYEAEHEAPHIPVITIVKPDRWFRWDSARVENNKSYPCLTVFPINSKYPPEKLVFEIEAVIFGFEPVEYLLRGVPTSTSSPNGDTILKYVVPASEPLAGDRRTLVLDKEGRIKTFTWGVRPEAKKQCISVWTVSDYVRANKGWVPGRITRTFHKQNVLINKIDYKLTKLETGKPVVDKWFLNKVNEPTFVTDYRYHGVWVEYFTKDKLLSDKEVERRASAIAGRDKPLRIPRSPWKVVGTGLILLGIALLIWKAGWPRKQSKEE